MKRFALASALALAVLSAPVRAATVILDIAIPAPGRTLALPAIPSTTLSVGDTLDLTYRQDDGGLFTFPRMHLTIAGLNGPAVTSFTADYSYAELTSASIAASGQVTAVRTGALVFRTPFAVPDGPASFRSFNIVYQIDELFDVVDGHLVSADSVTFNQGFFFPAALVPEPGTWATLLIGFGGIGFRRRRKSKGRVVAAVR